MSHEDHTAVIVARRVAEAVVAVVNDTPDGAPAGLLYAALMQYVNLQQFEELMAALVYAERITKRGVRYFPA